MEETVVQILMRRDGNTEEEANLRVDECVARMREACGSWDFSEVEDILREELGLEPDYILELLG